ncbi:hypothetical protein QC764_0098930 [Podospora pseudoanserina]|uniref:Uncharacterized protein n=1 Tax=Podospora pseudoanserina TaxID=2609844 RepID=A0ABR0HVC2_9PEZI|nr:hypothetical protein QC764_0098930 [Podospora pseudoanserina]
MFVMVQEQEAAVTRKKGHGPKYVILVGGFGRSRYLFSYLKKKLGNEIEILQSRGASPWAAICRGAVIQSISFKGRSNLSIDVQGRISRTSYGTLCTVKWETKIDLTTLPTFTNPVGKVIYVLKYDIEMTVAGGILDFAVYRDGVRQGGKSVMIEYENA